ncbi:hypothetical protein AIZ15_24855, partial [Salmonella enterica subsp. enterica serovar Typhimurium]
SGNRDIEVKNFSKRIIVIFDIVTIGLLYVAVHQPLSNSVVAVVVGGRSALDSMLADIFVSATSAGSYARLALPAE